MIVHYSPEKIEIKKSILDLLIKCQDKMQIVRCSVLDSGHWCFGAVPWAWYMEYT